MKKIGALLLAIVMVLAIGTSAFAADDDYKGSGHENATSVARGNVIPLTKGIIFFNENGSKVYEPNIKFEYTVAPDPAVAADGTIATVTDKDNVTRTVYPGPADGVTGTSIAFSAANDIKTSAANGAEVEESGNLSLNTTKFTRPGIYRYVITESVAGSGTDAENLAAAGLTARNTAYTTTRYLDVYIKYNAAGTGFEMYGAVIFASTETTTPGSDDITTNTEKTTGFEPGVGTPASFAEDPNVDKYTTYDFAVKKTVSGSMADKNHEFPFFVKISNTITGAKYTYIDKPGTGNGSPDTIANAAIEKGTDSVASALKLKDGEYVKFVGVPSNQSNELEVVVTEYNDTYDQYTPSVKTENKATITLNSTNEATGNAMIASTGSDTTSSFAVKTNDVKDQIITIDNNLTEISPTGVVLRVAPYAMILVAGLALMLISRRRNAMESDEE